MPRIFSMPLTHEDRLKGSKNGLAVRRQNRTDLIRKAHDLYDVGLRIDAIAESLGKKQRTIRNYLKEQPEGKEEGNFVVYQDGSAKGNIYLAGAAYIMLFPKGTFIVDFDSNEKLIGGVINTELISDGTPEAKS